MQNHERICKCLDNWVLYWLSFENKLLKGDLTGHCLTAVDDDGVLMPYISNCTNADKWTFELTGKRDADGLAIGRLKNDKNML